MFKIMGISLLNQLSMGTFIFFITIILILIFRPIAKKIGFTDTPCLRKKHNGHIPLVGGISIFLSISLMLLLFYSFDGFFRAYILASSLLVVVGIFDDYKGIGVLPRFLGQIAAALIMINLGHVEITSFGDLFGTGEIFLGQWSSLFTIISIIGCINAFNMIDGLDGLAGSLSVSIFIILASISDLSIYSNITILCLLFVGSLLGFLMFNFRLCGRNATVFLGDTGSTLIGFSIAWIVIALSQGKNSVIEPVTVLWIISLPIMDAVAIMIRRIKQKRSPFAPDHEHFHHILPLAGFSVNKTIFTILALSILFSMIGIYAEHHQVSSHLMFYLFLSLFGLYFWGMCHAWKLMKLTRKITLHGGDDNL